MNQALIIAMMMLGTMITRFLPFLVFPAGREMPPYMAYLSKNLPYATIGLLVVYCLKGATPAVYPFGLPELLAVVGIVALHCWKKNSLLSIGAGTVFYMVLVQLVFTS